VGIFRIVVVESVIGQQCPRSLPGKDIDLSTDATAYPEKEPTYDVTYAHDEAAGVNGIGRRTSMLDASGGSSWTYDERGRLTQETSN